MSLKKIFMFFPNAKFLINQRTIFTHPYSTIRAEKSKLLANVKNYGRLYSGEECCRRRRNRKICKNTPKECRPLVPECEEKGSTLQGAREFFAHPLTWKKNNGFFNLLIALTLFTFCFCSQPKKDETDKKKEKEKPKPKPKPEPKQDKDKDKSKEKKK